MKSCILALDVGTSAVKASLVSEKLKIIGEISCGYPTYTPRMRQVEQNPQDWWYAACRASRELMECLGGYSVEAVAVSGHMLGLLSVDKRGEPLTASMIHADTRSETEADYIAHAFGKDYMYDLTGNVLSPAATLCKALWLKENMGDIYKKSARFLQCKDYLNFRMTGNLNSTDYSDASHGMLIDIRKKRYLSDVFADIGLNSELFPELHASTDIIGRLTQNAAVELGLVSGIPVVAGGGDGACSNAGAGIGTQGDVYCSLGTTGWIACNMDKPYVDPKRRVFNILSLDGQHSGVFGTVQCVGKSVAWAQQIYAPEGIDEFNRIAAEVPSGSEGLIYLPYLEGERSPIFDAKARGVFFGMTSVHTRGHFARAVFEGVSCALASILDILREQMPIAQMRVIGGGLIQYFGNRYWRILDG